MARATVKRTNPTTGSDHVVYTDASGGLREAVVLAADGQDAPVTVQQVGSTLPLATVGASYAPVTGNLTAAQPTPGTPVAGGTVATGDIGLAGNVTVGISGTYSGVSVVFEVSPDSGTTWYPAGAAREDTGGNEGGIAFALPSNTTRLWTMAAPGFNRFRVRATAYTSGTAAVIILAGSYPFAETVTAIQAPLVGTPAWANVPAATTSSTLRAANGARKGLIITNTGGSGGSNLYIDLTGGTASSTRYSIMLAPGASYIMDPTTFTAGLITGAFAAATGGGAMVTEFT